VWRDDSKCINAPDYSRGLPLFTLAASEAKASAHWLSRASQVLGSGQSRLRGLICCSVRSALGLYGRFRGQNLAIVVAQGTGVLNVTTVESVIG
jgi:hypothetical protein